MPATLPASALCVVVPLVVGLVVGLVWVQAAGYRQRLRPERVHRLFDSCSNRLVRQLSCNAHRMLRGVMWPLVQTLCLREDLALSMRAGLRACRFHRTSLGCSRARTEAQTANRQHALFHARVLRSRLRVLCRLRWLYEASGADPSPDALGGCGGKQEWHHGHRQRDHEQSARGITISPSRVRWWQQRRWWRRQRRRTRLWRRGWRQWRRWKWRRRGWRRARRRHWRRSGRR